MVKKILTDAAVKRLKPPPKPEKKGEAAQADYFDQGYPGLALRVSYGGRKAWTYFYRHNGKLKRMALGTYPATSLAEAREAWRAAKEVRDRGRDPATEKKRQAGATEFEAVLAEWLHRDQSGNRSKDDVKRIIDKDATPSWKGRHVSDLTRRDVLDVIDAVVDRGAPVMARRLHAHLHRFFRWCVGRGIIPANPMADLPKPGAETKRERVLSDAELKAVWQACDKIGWPFGPAIQLLILTGARRQEIGALRWSEIDLPQICVRLAGDRTKNSQPHTIPLSKPALTIIEGLPRVQRSGGADEPPVDYVFTTNGKTPISGWSKAKSELPEMSEPWTLHDLRRTVATGIQRLDVSLQVIEAVLGHVSGSRAGVVGVYQRHSFDKEKRAALEAWGAHVVSLVEGEEAL